MHQDLQVKGHVALVGDDERRGQRGAVECDTVDCAKLVGPGGAGGLVEALGGEAKVELDTGLAGGFGG